MSICLTASAVRQRTHRMSDGSVLTFKVEAPRTNRVLQTIRLDWDPNKVYKLPVVLVSFADCDFKEEHDLQFYKDLFNKKGFNLGHGPGCVADYFYDQSRGLFNVEFDVVGPIKLTTNQKASHDSNFGTTQFRQAIKDAASQLNYADYDWDGDYREETVIIIFAGYGGNETSSAADNCIRPNTDNLYFSIDGIRIGGYSASPEMWTNNQSCGIGSICHELSHVLGLPDVYPTSGAEYSVCDEWNLMDGGNYADDGWCPPNYSAQEREIVNWQSPEELTENCTITDMPSYNSTGKSYKIVNSENPNEYYTLENRQWEGWDYMLPNHGLLITHVKYDDKAWRENRINTLRYDHRFEYLHADGLDYNNYFAMYNKNDLHGADGRSKMLKNTTYPYMDAVIPVLYGVSISDVTENDGLISFNCVVGGDGISTVVDEQSDDTHWYDLQGRRLNSKPTHKGVYIHNRKKVAL